MMGREREVADRLTEAMFSGNIEGVKALYAPDAVAETPDAGTLAGPEAIVEWLSGFLEACPDGVYELAHAHECGGTAVDEGYLVGTHTGPLVMPDGEVVPPTGRRVRLRSCDIATVEDGLITSHRFYYDQVEFMIQLGLMPGEPA
jgi:ketosteroid isomerase-like protein